MSDEQLATLSKQEILFGFTKMSRYWHGGVLQIVQVTMVVCAAWALMAMVSEIDSIVDLIGAGGAASQEIPARLILPTVQFNLVVISFKIFADKLPATLKTYMMATSTEMMKDRKVIEQVVQEQKQLKNERNYRVF